jgi:hypothetical protein
MQKYVLYGLISACGDSLSQSVSTRKKNKGTTKLMNTLNFHVNVRVVAHGVCVKTLMRRNAKTVNLVLNSTITSA